MSKLAGASRVLPWRIVKDIQMAHTATQSVDAVVNNDGLMVQFRLREKEVAEKFMVPVVIRLLADEGIENKF